jgi:hypothetical protein
LGYAKVHVYAGGKQDWVEFPCAQRAYVAMKRGWHSAAVGTKVGFAWCCEPVVKVDLRAAA